LSKLDRLNQQGASGDVTPKKARRKRQREVIDEKIVVERNRIQHKRKKRRVVSGALLEEGDGGRLRGLRGGDKYADSEDEARFKKKRLCRLASFEPNLGTDLSH
jgi:glucan 1,3-beta-glucosidase